MNNIIILDLDGVITTHPNETDNLHKDGYSDFNPVCVKNLNSILKDTGYDIVLSSARRSNVDIDKMNEYFRARGVDKEIISYVPLYSSDYVWYNREIEKFIEDFDVVNYLIIDDDKSLSGASE